MSSELCREWAQKAEEDFQAAVLLSRKRKPPLLSLVCFHSQQATEKYLKSFLTLNRVSFPKTHDLILLKNLCARTDTDFELIADLAISLNPYSVEFRYPGERATRRDAKRALSAVKEIRHFMLGKIKTAL